MNRPTARQLQAFYQAMADAERQAARIPSREEMLRRRDQYLASLKA